MKNRIKVFIFLLSLEEHSAYYSNEKQLLCACFCLATGLYKSYHTSAQMGIPCIKMCEKQILKTHSRYKFLKNREYIADKTDHQILHSCILLTIKCCFGNCKPQTLMFKLLQKSKYPTKMLNFLAEHTLIIYMQFIIGPKSKASPLKEKSFENETILNV